MDHGSTLIMPILEILEMKFPTLSIILEILGISVFLISHILEILEICFFQFLIWWKYGRRAGGSRAGLGSGGLGLFVEHVPGKASMVTLELKSKHALFSKRLPRPNHYAHKICIEILSKHPV